MQLRHVIFASIFAVTTQFDVPEMRYAPPAQAAAISIEQVAAFKSKLAQAEASRDLLGRRSVCLMEHLTAQQQLSADRERALGQAMYLQIELERQVVQSEVAVKGYEDLVQSENQNVQARRAVFEKARRERDEQADRVRTCSQVLFFLPGICQGGEAVVKGFGWMNDAEREYREAQPRLRNAEEALAGVRNQLENNRRQLVAAQQSHVENQSAVKQLEEQITKLKTAISTINVKVQDFNVLVGTFTNTLKEATAVDTDDAKIRQIDRLSAEIDVLTKDVPHFISSTESGLPDEAMRACGS
ncbi:hypothetical protein [Agrobacterium fabrum]|uniref:hypothetical protein n=1 Tax=Agrobacterium fabrum TaxID=1176649 RepID=UPI003BA3427F